MENRILTLRGQKVILDRDLAALYGVKTLRLNEAVKRNKDRFPGDFCFQLTREEFTRLISQIAISNSGRGGVRKLPRAFTEHGALMAANVLNSPKAIEMSLFLVRAFIKLRERLSATAELEKRLESIEKSLISHDIALRDIYRKLKPLLLAHEPGKPPKRIGFTADEKSKFYRA
ncbi:MAG TPA: ORF6N domain-containing protein [bacterium]|nr:ORF6N domain-containing protein [bacterium]